MELPETTPARVGAEVPDTAGRPPGDPDDPLDRLAANIGAREHADAVARDHHLVEVLTRGFVQPMLGAVAGHELGLVYRPADGETAGGDLYGAWELPGGRAAVLIGDVTGKGLETAATSAMTRYFIEAVSWEQADPALVLERADAILCNRLPADTFVTAFLGLLDGNELRFANAGHLPPLLLRAGGASDELPTGGAPLGIGETGGWESERIALAAGDLLLAYTDGIVEARRAGEFFGPARVRDLATVAAVTAGPGVLAEEIHDAVRLWAGELTDDAVVLALRAGRA